MLKADLIVVIPTKEPGDNMLPLVKKLKASGFRKIVLVNDGCGPKHDTIFEIAKDKYGCDVLTHVTSLGKGRSLKNAFNYILENYPFCAGIITVDDVVNNNIDEIDDCAINLQRHPTEMILGCRDYNSRVFSAGDRLNNKIKRKLIKVLSGIDVSDTSTGLRGIPIRLVKPLLTVDGEDVEYELNVLLYSQEKGIPIREFLIKPKENEKAEFNPLKSLRIYVVFLSYCMTSVIATILDFLVFSTAVASTKIAFPMFYITISTIIARVCSGSLNFYLSKNTVFKKTGNNKKMMGRFFFIVALQMGLSALLVSVLYSIMPITETVVKMIVDAILFIVFYQVQREWVFNDQKNEGNSKHFKLPILNKDKVLPKLRKRRAITNRNNS